MLVAKVLSSFFQFSFSRISEFTTASSTGYAFSACVGSFASLAIDTK